MKIDKPNYTQVPNVILDSLHEITPAQAKVVMVICRESFGWHQSRSRYCLSVSTLEERTNLSRQGVVNALDGLIKKGWIKRHPEGQSFCYEIDFETIQEPCNSVARSMQTSCTVPCNSVARSENPHIYEERKGNKDKETLESHQEKYAEQIYAAYPKKVGKPKAIAAILKALKKKAPAELLAATEKYAEATAEHDRQFIPHPATWFGQERYNDDSATWGGSSRNGRYSAPKPDYEAMERQARAHNQEIEDRAARANL